MRTTVISIALVSMLVALAFSPMVYVQSQGADPAEVVSKKDYGEDNDGDLLFEFLVINFTLFVSKSGKYKVYGTLVSYNIQIGKNNTIKDLGAGIQYIEIRFNSTLIFNNGKDGQFLLEFNIRNDNIVPPWFEEGNYTTNTYNHLDFDDPKNFPITPEKYKPKISKQSENERYVLSNDVMTIWFYYKIPRLVWFYTKDNKSRTKYFCEFIALHGYIDSGAGRYEPGNSPYLGVFGDPGRTISTSPMIDDKSKIFGDYVAVTITYSDIPIKDSTSVLRLANITFSLMLSAGDRTTTLDNQKYYTINGGTQLTLSIGVDLRLSLAMNGLAIEQEIWSETNKSYTHDFVLEDQGTTRITRDSTDSNDYKYFAYKEPSKITFLPRNTQEKKAEGYYYWVNRAKVDGVFSSNSMTYQYAPKEKRLSLYLSFRTSGTSITTVQSDPLGIGVNEDGNPTTQTYVKPKQAEQPSVLITVMGWFTAIILVILPLYVDFRRAQKKLRELEEEFGEDF